MMSERIQRRIERLIDEAEQAAARQDWGQSLALHVPFSLSTPR